MTGNAHAVRRLRLQQIKRFPTFPTVITLYKPWEINCSRFVFGKVSFPYFFHFSAVGLRQSENSYQFAFLFHLVVLNIVESYLLQDRFGTEYHDGCSLNETWGLISR